VLHHGCKLLSKSQQSMIDQNQYLWELAKRTAAAYIADPKTKAAMVTGSVTEGLCDEYSDCEIIFYYDELPSEISERSESSTCSN
jgi:hypothetical protein